MVYDILNYIMSCPYLSDFNYNVDFLGKNPYSLSIGGKRSRETVRVYTDGEALVKDTFFLRLRLPYGMDMEKNLENCRLTENISKWFLENRAEGFVSVSVDFSAEGAQYSADTVVYTARVAVVHYKTKSL